MSVFRRALPFGVLLVLAVSGSAAHAGLFVSGLHNNAVLEYNGTSGAFVKTFASGGGLSGPQGLVFGPNGDLFVSGQNNNAVLEYNGTSGAFVKTFTSGGSLNLPVGLVFGPNGDLFVSGFVNNAVLEYNGTSGAFIKTFTSGGNLLCPTFLTFGPSVSAVPEPPSLLLAALGALTALATAGRRRAAAFFRPAKPCATRRQTVHSGWANSAMKLEAFLQVSYPWWLKELDGLHRLFQARDLTTRLAGCRNLAQKRHYTLVHEGRFLNVCLITQEKNSMVLLDFQWRSRTMYVRLHLVDTCGRSAQCRGALCQIRGGHRWERSLCQIEEPNFDGHDELSVCGGQSQADDLRGCTRQAV
jgi:hypothetical protein